jgi:hypothetical protein
MLGRRNRFTRKKLMSEGVAAPATVLEIADGGMTVTHGSEGYVGNTEVILKTRLRVEPPGLPTFEVEQKFRYGQMNIPSAGSVLHVRFDADDHDKIMIDTSAAQLISPRLSEAVGLDLGGLMATVREQQAAGADRAHIADALKAQLGVSGIPVVQFGGVDAESPGEERIRNLERLAALRGSGALTAEEFAAQKAALLAEKP